MPTRFQETGAIGENLVAARCPCPRCKRRRTLRRLPTNFKCADVICDFCGYLAQVKTKNVRTVEALPSQIAGAAWSVQRDRMRAGIYFPIFLVLRTPERRSAIYYIPVEFQDHTMFKAKRKLSPSAKRAGWQGFVIDIRAARRAGMIARLDLRA